MRVKRSTQLWPNSTLWRVQARVQQAEHLLRQQRALLKQYSNPHSRNSKVTCHTADLKASENESWQSCNDDTARLILHEVSVSNAALPQDVSALNEQVQDHQIALPAAQSADYVWHSKGRSSRASSVASLNSKKVANRKRQDSFAGHLVDIDQHKCQGCARLLDLGVHCLWCKRENDSEHAAQAM